MKGVARKLWVPVLLLAAGAAVHAVAQSVPEPPAGTIAAEMKERTDSQASSGGLIDVTAVETTLIAFDKSGRAVLDLRPEELMVLEDGEPVKLLALDPGLAAEDTESTRIPVMSNAGTTVGESQITAQPWRVVIYVSTELAGRFVLPTLCRRTAGEATRMTDLNPADFYIPLVEQIDPNLAVVLRSDYSMLSLEEDVRQMVEVALAYGWTIMPINLSRASFIYGAEVAGAGKVQHLQGVGANSISSQQSEFRQVAPNYPLQIIANATGGEFVANEGQLERALNHIRGAYVVTYQVDRPVDGELHRLEIRCTRPGVRLRGRRYAASGSLRGVSTTRAQRLLSGDDITGSLVMSADVRNITIAGKGLRLGDLDVDADLGRLRPLLSPLDLGQIRVTVVVEIENGLPFIHHQEIAVNWGKMANEWQFSADIRWPKNAKRMAVVVEELVTSTWGATTVELR